MRRIAAIIAGLLAAWIAAWPARALDLPTPAELVSGQVFAEESAAAPGAALWTDIRLAIKPGWHIYWRNPGDAGLPTSVAWSLPPGFAAGEIEWPVPERFVTGTLANYGYRDRVDLLVPVTAPAALDPSRPVTLSATVSWLACTEICIPGETKLSLDLPAGAAPDPSVARLFADARARLPVPAKFTVRALDEGSAYRLGIPAGATAGLDHPVAAFLPYDAGAIDQAAAQRSVAGAEGFDLLLPKTDSKITGSAALDGVLTLSAGGETRAFTIAVTPKPAVLEAMAPWWQAVLLAVLGGAILNLMPCVFPILSLKVLGLARLADRREGRRHGAAYAAGVLASFIVLGATLLALRAGGTGVGWGFQLQSPVVVGLLAYLLLAMGLSLSGVAEFGAGLAGFGGRAAERGGIAGAFATGVLATVVATPCTAPFMGTALGFALVAPPAAAMAVFVALGAGLAAPFVLLAALPGLTRYLPRPGAWMMMLRQALAFPLYGTVAWLVWVLAQELDPGDLLLVLFGLVAVGFGVWVYGRTRASRPGGRRLGAALAALGAAAAIGLAATRAPATTPSQSAARDGLPYEAFTPARLAALTAEGQPVFVNLTASWCLTCLVNEHATLDRPAVRDAFATRGVVALKGDWTRRDPDITRLLERHGRSGVPLYLLYDKSGEAIVLPQILTEAAVLEAVRRL